MRNAIATFCCLLAGAQVLAGPNEALAAAVADVRTLPTEAAKQTRYLWMPGGYTEDERAALNWHVNRLSKSAKLRRVRVVGADLVAICLDHYRWPESLWEKLGDVEPYYTIRTEEIIVEVVEEYEVVQVVRNWPGGKWPGDGKVYAANSFTYYAEEKRKKPGAAKKTSTKKAVNAPNPIYGQRIVAELQQRTGSLTPLVRGDWWVVQTSRQVDLRNRETGTGYSDWLGVRDRGDFLALIRFSQKDSEDLGRHVRGAFDRSKVAPHGRQLAGFDSVCGKVFMTLDTKTIDRKNLPTELLSPGAYQHDAQEWLANSPNGLIFEGLFDSSAKGERQATVPDFIGAFNTSDLWVSLDKRVHVGLCQTCHVEDGFRPVNEWARRTFRGGLKIDIAGRKEQQEFEDLYLSDLDKQLDEGRRRHAEALVELNGAGWTGRKNATAFAGLYNAYAEAPVNIKRLALERGVEEKALLDWMRAQSQVPGGMPVSLAGLLNGGTVRRETIEDFWPVLTLKVK